MPSPGGATSSPSTSRGWAPPAASSLARSRKPRRTPTTSSPGWGTAPWTSSPSPWAASSPRTSSWPIPSSCAGSPSPAPAPRGGKDIDKVVATTYWDILRATLTRSDPKEFLFFNRDAQGKRAGKEYIRRLHERTEARDAPITIAAFRTQLKAIQRYGRSRPADLSGVTHPTLIANGDNDRMVPTPLSEDLHRRIPHSELIIYPNSGHGGIFQYWEKFAPLAAEFFQP